MSVTKYDPTRTWFAQTAATHCAPPHPVRAPAPAARTAQDAVLEHASTQVGWARASLQRPPVQPPRASANAARAVLAKQTEKQRQLRINQFENRLGPGDSGDKQRRQQPLPALPLGPPGPGHSGGRSGAAAKLAPIGGAAGKGAAPAPAASLTAKQAAAMKASSCLTTPARQRAQEIRRELMRNRAAAAGGGGSGSC